MGYWKQDKAFSLAKMGKKAGYCLQNVRLAYGIGSKYASAKDAMLANKNAGTLHPISTLPKNVAVPVFTDTSSPYEHVEVSDKGTFYSDGKRLTNPYNQRFYGWGETLNGVRIVSWVNTPANNNSGFSVGSKVTLINWKDYSGKALRKTRNFYFVKQIRGDRAVLAADRVNGPVYAAVKLNNLRKV